MQGMMISIMGVMEEASKGKLALFYNLSIAGNCHEIKSQQIILYTYI